MKTHLLIAASVMLFSNITFGQQWLHFPTGTTANWINLHDLDVSGNQITVEALASVRDTSSALFANAHDILSKHTGTTDGNYLLRHSGYWMNTTSGYVGINNPVRLCPDTVYHLAATYNGDSLKYFVNGQRVAAIHWTGNLFQNNLSAAIGNRSSDLNEQFIGYIDEVRIWNIARAESELSANMYDLPNPSAQSGLVAYYKFDGNYYNMQGSATWDGVAVGAQLQNATNPFFYGSISSNFCYATGINENDIYNAFELYPNPNQGNFIIDISFQEYFNPHLTISNVMGEKIKDIDLVSGKTEIKLEGSPSGIYFVVLNTDKGVYTRKVILQR